MQAVEGILGLKQPMSASPKSRHEKTGGRLVGVNAGLKGGVSTDVPSGMTPAIPVSPLTGLHLLLDGLSPLSLVTTTFLYPSAV